MQSSHLVEGDFVDRLPVGEVAWAEAGAKGLIPQLEASSNASNVSNGDLIIAGDPRTGEKAWCTSTRQPGRTKEESQPQKRLALTTDFLPSFNGCLLPLKK